MNDERMSRRAEQYQNARFRKEQPTLTVQPTSPSAERKNWIPHKPWPKQQIFLDLDCLEALYGGAAGGGKSEALLMAALQFVHLPGYAALLLRRDTQRMSLAGGLISKSHEWLSNTDAKWSGVHKRWTFPTGAEPATLTFGYLRDRHDKYRYGSSEFQYIAFDELTEFPQDDYLFLFSRLRRRRGLAAPLRMRSASNPGGPGHLWVRSRFIHPDILAGGEKHELGDVVWQDGHAYVPARIADNPALDETEYRQALVHVPPITRERLMNGDWTIQEQGLIQNDWLRYYQLTGSTSPKRGETLHLLATSGVIVLSLAARDCRRFVTIDPAGTSADRVRERQGRQASWTVAQVWDQPWGVHSHVLILRDQVRERVGFDGLCRILDRLHEQWQPAQMWIENEKLGQAAVDVLKSRLPLRTIATQSRDKVARAAMLIDKLQRGEVFLPKHDLQWRPQLEAELLAWTGDPQEAADQIDAAAYAAILAVKQRAGAVPVQMSTLTMPLFSPAHS